MDSTVIDEDYLLLTDKLLQKVTTCLQKAEQQYRKTFDYQAVEINIRGRAAGQIRYGYATRGNRSGLTVNRDLPILRFNPYLLAKYKETFIDQVVPHECAHLVAYALFGMKIKPHGLEWKTQMSALYGLLPKVTHTFEVPKRVRKTFAYLCACEDVTHRLTAIRHNKIRRETARYLCKNCGSALAEV